MSHKHVHCRSIYRTPPNFKEMAIKYPKFRKFAIQELSGRLTINFKNAEALQALTTTLLKNDFGLDVEIPLDRLIPTVPSRLNYVLWMEDLLQAAGISGSEVHGIDIGTGASCIYSLLAAKTKYWHMLATEVDAENYKCAVENVRRNNLHQLIQVRHVDAGVLLKGALSEGQQYDFCMCNPPFFSNEAELDSEGKSRSPARPPPRNCRTGSPGDVLVSGGEVAFVSKIIEESKELGTVVRIYSSLLGHKSSLGQVKSQLQAAGATSTVDTAFCQGRTSRWYIAWTFLTCCDLKTTQQQVTQSGKKNKPPLQWVVPRPSDPAQYTLGTVGSRVKEMLLQLQMSVRGLRSNDNVQSFQVTAFNNTWSNQRKKRRAALLKDNMNIDNPASTTIRENRQPSYEHSDGVDVTDVRCSAESANVTSTNNVEDEGKALSEKVASSCVSESNGPSVSQETSAKYPDINPGKTTEEHSISNTKRKFEDVIILSKKLKTDNLGCLLRVGVLVIKKDDDIHLEMAFVEGTGGRESLHQVMQYFKNNFKL